MATSTSTRSSTSSSPCSATSLEPCEFCTRASQNPSTRCCAYCPILGSQCPRPAMGNSNHCKFHRNVCQKQYRNYKNRETPLRGILGEELWSRAILSGLEPSEVSKLKTKALIRIKSLLPKIIQGREQVEQCYVGERCIDIHGGHQSVIENEKSLLVMVENALQQLEEKSKAEFKSLKHEQPITPGGFGYITTQATQPTLTKKKTKRKKKKVPIKSRAEILKQQAKLAEEEKILDEMYVEAISEKLQKSFDVLRVHAEYIAKHIKLPTEEDLLEEKISETEIEYRAFYQHVDGSIEAISISSVSFPIDVWHIIVETFLIDKVHAPSLLKHKETGFNRKEIEASQSIFLAKRFSEKLRKLLIELSSGIVLAYTIPATFYTQFKESMSGDRASELMLNFINQWLTRSYENEYFISSTEMLASENDPLFALLLRIFLLFAPNFSRIVEELFVELFQVADELIVEINKAISSNPFNLDSWEISANLLSPSFILKLQNVSVFNTARYMEHLTKILTAKS